MTASKRKSACVGCRNTETHLNGLYCTRLGLYVEYMDYQPCTRIFRDSNK